MDNPISPEEVDDSTSDNSTRIERVRCFLKKYRIFAEIFAATVLASMALIVSFAQVIIADRQTDLLHIQTDLAKKQTTIAEKALAEDQRAAAFTEAIEWTQLWDVIRTLLWNYPDQYSLEWGTLSYDQKLSLVSEMSDSVSPVGRSPLVIGRKYLFERYLAIQTELEMAHRVLTAHKEGNIKIVGDEKIRMDELPDIPFRCVTRTISHIRAIQIDLGMFRSSKPPEDESFMPSEIMDSIFRSGFPWNPKLEKGSRNE